MQAVQYHEGNRDLIVFDLCGGSGAGSKDYKDAGYDVRLVTLPWHDVLEYSPTGRAHGVIASPPCTDLASSGARWWKAKGPLPLHGALRVVQACLEFIKRVRPVFWCLENPVGRLIHYLGKPQLYFNPCDYGDPYTKKTCLWGNFNLPRRNPVEPTQGSKMHLMCPHKDRAALRSITPPGFARAFFEANQ